MWAKQCEKYELMTINKETEKISEKDKKNDK